MALFGCDIRICSLEQTLQENFGPFVYTINYFLAHSIYTQCFLHTVDKTFFFRFEHNVEKFLVKVAYYSFYEARARATIRLPDVNIACARKTFASNTKGNENKFEPFIRKLRVSESFRRF